MAGRGMSVSQAKNAMRRAIAQISDPMPTSREPVWDYFESRCAYCDRVIDRSRREGHIDHADSDGGNHLGNLILACQTCNGDEKREAGWLEFLRSKVSDDDQFKERQARIESWMASHPATRRALSPQAVRLQQELEEFVGIFGDKCAELRGAINT